MPCPVARRDFTLMLLFLACSSLSLPLHFIRRNSLR
jgi:hypothetical protein